MGFDEGIIRKVQIFLKPTNIYDAIELMTEVNGIYQHDYYDNKTNLCFIFKKEKKYHRDFIKEDTVNIPVNDEFDQAFENEIKQRRIIKAPSNNKTEEECLICLEKINVNKGNRLPCGHFCCESCLFNYLKTEIESAKVVKLKCFVKDCEYEFTEQFIISQLKEDKVLIDKYKLLNNVRISFSIKIKNFVLNQTAIAIYRKWKINMFNVKTDINIVISV